MGAREILEEVATRQGWSDESKLDLLCRFIDNLELLLPANAELRKVHTDLGSKDPVEVFEKWLENRAEWENEFSLPVEVNRGS